MNSITDHNLWCNEFVKGIQGLAQGKGAYKVQATVWPVVSEPAMKKTANSSISRDRVRGLPSLSLSRSRCPAVAQTLKRSSCRALAAVRSLRSRS